MDLETLPELVQSPDRAREIPAGRGADVPVSNAADQVELQSAGAQDRVRPGHGRDSSFEAAIQACRHRQ